jgi:hypothetical protein
LLLGAAAALMMMLARARRDPQRAMRWHRVWSGAMIAIIAVAAAIDLAFSPLAAEYTERVAPAFEAVALPVAVLHALAAIAVQIAVLALVRRWRP